MYSTVKRFSTLKQQLVEVSKSNYYGDRVHDDATVTLRFSEGCEIRADYWRVIKRDRYLVSSFDHLHKYGLSEAIDAIQVLRRETNGKQVVASMMDVKTGDIILTFSEELEVQIFCFSSYEVWEAKFPGNIRVISNTIPRCPR